MGNFYPFSKTKVSKLLISLKSMNPRGLKAAQLIMKWELRKELTSSDFRKCDSTVRLYLCFFQQKIIKKNFKKSFKFFKLPDNWLF